MTEIHPQHNQPCPSNEAIRTPSGQAARNVQSIDNGEQDEPAPNRENETHLRPRRTNRAITNAPSQVTEKQFSKYIVATVKFCVIFFVLLCITGPIFSAGNNQGSHNTHIVNAPRKAFPIDNIQVQINLNKDGSAQVTETWHMEYVEKLAKSSWGYLSSYREYCTAELEDLRISENGNELQFLDHKSTSELDPGSFTFYESTLENDEHSTYHIDFRPNDDGSKEMVLQYHLKNFVTMLEGEKAVLEYQYRDGGEREWQARSVSVCISMDGCDLSENSLYDGTTSFHGYAGFDGPDYQIKTFNELKKNSRIVIHLALSPELFENLASWHGKMAGGDLVITDQNDIVDQKLISIDFYRLCILAAIVMAVLAVALLTIVAIHLRRVYGTSHGDDLILSKSSKRHWIRYMSSSLILSIVLIGLLGHVFNIIPSPDSSLGNLLLVFLLGAILFFNSLFMADGMITLRKLAKQQEKAVKNADTQAGEQAG